jgi:hypothetical protein
MIMLGGGTRRHTGGGQTAHLSPPLHTACATSPYLYIRILDEEVRHAGEMTSPWVIQTHQMGERICWTLSSTSLKLVETA